MKSKYPEKYEPGELYETRKRLGELDEAEAKKYALMLGGEIGVEKGKAAPVYNDDDALKEKSVSASEDGPQFLSSNLSKRKIPYVEQLKIDFLCAGPEYRLKTKGNAVLAVFRFLFPRRDYVNPFFLVHGEDLFYTNIENCVTAVRALSAIARYTNVLERVSEYYRKIISVIASWNIEGLHLDIIRLKQQPKRKQMRLLRSMVRNVYFPIICLSALDDQNDLLRALRSVYTELLKLGSIAGKKKRLDTYYNVAKTEFPIVFGRIKYTLYPLLMKVCETDFIPSADIFTSRREEIALPLMISEDQIVTKESFLVQPGGENGESNEEEEQIDGPENDNFNGMATIFILSPVYGESELFFHGGNMIEALFPRCGWGNTGEFVDFYAYFTSVLPYPKGIELLAPEGALIRVITLTLIIQELLPGFRGIDFGIIRDEDENPQGLTLEIGEITSNWYRYGEEILGKRYIPLLQEYSRNAEQDMHFRSSPYGKRLLSELHWTVKHYFLPYLMFQAESGTRPPADSAVSPLKETVDRFLFLLKAVVSENLDPDTGVTDSIKNPKQPFFFEVENIVSRRLRLVLRRNSLPVDNVALIDTVYLLACHLDEIIDNPLSLGYSEEEPVPYRRAGKEVFTPVYTVKARDTLTLLAEDEEDSSLP